MMVFEKESDLTQFLNTLKIPTQIILDQETFHGDLPTFLLKNDFHHTICVQENANYELSLQNLRYGALLIHPSQLNSLQWWWNRTTIMSSKIKGDILPENGVFAVLSPADQRLEKSWSQIFTEYCAHISKECLTFSARNLHLFQSNAIVQLRENWPTLSTIVVQDLDRPFPRDLRKLLAQLYHESISHNLQIVLDVQSSQVLFESLLDWSTVDSQKGLYRLQLNRTKMIHKNSFVGMFPVCPRAMTLEYVRYTWLAGQNVS
jgi:hypothetical protein